MVVRHRLANVIYGNAETSFVMHHMQYLIGKWQASLISLAYEIQISVAEVKQSPIPRWPLYHCLSFNNSCYY
jgi:hypothetical protein